MNIYVETNFVLELTLIQEDYESCEHILSLCESGDVQLFIPAYSLAEPNETLTRHDGSRKQLAKALQDEHTQLIRSSQGKNSDIFQAVLRLLTVSGEEQWQQFTQVRERLLRLAEIIPLDKEIVLAAAVGENRFDLSPQDALVFASVLQHLILNPDVSCFLTKNSKDFKAVDIRQTLADYGCKLLFSFSDGLSYIQSQI